MISSTLVGFISKNAMFLWNLKKKIKTNKNQCERLIDIVEAIAGIVKTLQITKLDQPEMKQALERFNKTLEKCLAFVQTFTDASIWNQMLWNITSYQKEFESLNEQLSKSITNLNLSLNIAPLFDHHQDISDQQRDRAEISTKLDDIAMQMAQQQQESLVRYQQMEDEFKQRFASFRHQIQRSLIKAEKSDASKKLEDEEKLFFQIPATDIVREECIGQGGFADVFRATWLSQDHRIVVKVIRVVQLTEDVKKGFLNEIATMQGVRYDHLLNFFGACMEPDCHALVVEYMALGSLFHVLRNKQPILSWPERWSIALQMTKGINYLHMKSILHRDIKSLNILMDQPRDGYIVKVSDFGLAKIRQKTSRQTIINSGKQITIGTLQWKAPELFKLGQPSYPSDVYALGVVFWKLATGRVPYEDADDQVIAFSVGTRHRLEIPDDVPYSFASMISDAWHQEPSKRPTCQKLISNIKTCLSSETIKISTDHTLPGESDPVPHQQLDSSLPMLITTASMKNANSLEPTPSSSETLAIPSTVSSATQTSYTVVALNVSGERMRVSRAALTLIDGTRLSELFSGNHEDQLSKDEDGYIILNCNPKLFIHLIEQLEVWLLNPARKRMFEPLLNSEHDFASFLMNLNFADHFFNSMCFHQTDETFVNSYGHEIQISENGRACTVIDSGYYASCALGRLTYRIGVHRFHLIAFYDMAFIGVLPDGIKPVRTLIGSYFDTRGTHGWWIDDHIYVNGQSTKRKWTDAAKNVVYELIIDCDERRLGIRNNATTRFQSMDVDLTDASLPWRLFVGLKGPRNRLILL